MAGAYLLRRGLFMPGELDALMDPELVRGGPAPARPARPHRRRAASPAPRGAFAAVAALETSLYMRNQLLRDADWAGMAHSLESACRWWIVPLLEAIAPLTVAAHGRRKAWLARAPRSPLPPEVIARAKTGFGTPVAMATT